MSTTFTKALIRACKRRVSGHDVDFKQVIGDFAMMEPEHVSAEDIRHHFAEAVATMALVQQSFWRGVLVDLAKHALRDPSMKAKVVSDLAYTEVEMLRRMGLWDDEEKAATAAVVNEPVSDRPPICNDKPEEDDVADEDHSPGCLCPHYDEDA